MKQELTDHHESLSGSKAVEQIRAVAKGARICLFGTAVSRVPLSVRPMAVQSVDDGGALWFLSDRRSHTNRDILADPRVQLLFSNPGDSQYLTLQGTATISDDPELKKQHWTPIAKTWFNAGLQDPDLTVIRVEPSDGYYWDTKHGKVFSMLSIATGAVTGKTIDDSIEGQVRL
jgi:general stress protein 26